MKLRDYQKLAVRHVLQRIRDGYRRMYIDLPTGTGKGVVLATVAAQRLPAGRVLVLIHRQEIALQLVEALRQAELTVGLIMQGYRELTAPIVVATIQSLTSANLHALLNASDVPIATILVDEAHHVIEGSAYERIITSIESCGNPEPVITIGYTATPYRYDKRSMFSVLPTCAFERSIPDMVRAGWLAPLTWVPLKVNIDLERVTIKEQRGELDYMQEELARELVQGAIIDAIARQTVPIIVQRRALVYTVAVEHARRLAEAFCGHGLKASAVSGETNRIAREEIFANWQAGNIRVVCNCNLLTEGYNYPEISALVIARPTLSPVQYVQMLGRGARLAPGKKDCLVIDVMGNRPDTSGQVVLPHIVGVTREESKVEVENRQKTDPFLKALLGAEAESGLSLLDPIGQSHYRWIASRNGYFASVGRQEAVILEKDPNGSGLYRSRLYIMPRGEGGQHRWIEQNYLPLRQQVALAHEYTGSIYVEELGGKEAQWLDRPATDKQLAALQRMYPGLARQAIAKGWTRRMASDAITYCLLRYTLRHPPTP